MEKVFVSHASDDRSEIAIIARGLLRYGFQIVIQEPMEIGFSANEIRSLQIETIAPGENYRTRLLEELEQCITLGCLSKHWLNYRRRHFLSDEVVISNSRGRFIPCRIDDVDPGKIDVDRGLIDLGSMNTTLIDLVRLQNYLVGSCTSEDLVAWDIFAQSVCAEIGRRAGALRQNDSPHSALERTTTNLKKQQLEAANNLGSTAIVKIAAAGQTIEMAIIPPGQLRTDIGQCSFGRPFAISTKAIVPSDPTSWSDIKKIVEGMKCRLPSEAEWDYALFGGLGSDGLSLGSSTEWGLKVDEGANREWVEDPFRADRRIPKDGGPVPGVGSERVLKSCALGPSFRSAIDADQPVNSVGFRLVRHIA